MVVNFEQFKVDGITEESDKIICSFTNTCEYKSEDDIINAKINLASIINYGFCTMAPLDLYKTSVADVVVMADGGGVTLITHEDDCIFVTVSDEPPKGYESQSYTVSVVLDNHPTKLVISNIPNIELEGAIRTAIDWAYS